MNEDESTTQIKKRRITSKDWDTVADFVNTTLKQRESHKFRKKHERIWAEVDRQVSMQPVGATKKDIKDKGDWHNVIELGELARASEIITADAMRLLFPNNRMWFEAHTDIEDQDITRPEDKKLRAFMVQQHDDFGFKERINLSVHEALHHGGFVAEVDEETMLKIHDGSGVESMKAPVWKPHSMWNCYPDPSPSTLATNTFYNGSMIIKEYMPLYLLREQSGEGWDKSQIRKVKNKQNKNKDVETDDVELVKYFGDVVIKRQDGNILLPNSEVILANGTFVYFSASKLPYPRIIYNGYERMDVRDPYYVSPITKISPMHKMTSTLANKMLDGIDLHIEPPIVYDGGDPNFIENGGPLISPGAKTPTRSLANFKEVKVGDPNVAVNALTFALDQIRQSTAVDANRTGGGQPVERSATATRHQAQRGEVRVVDFVSKLDFSLKTFLYMQHAFNMQGMIRYPYYNPEMDQVDFQWMDKKTLPKNVHFEVVGSKGILGEEERSQKMLGVVAMAAQSEMFQGLLKPENILKQAFMDAGIKNPEQFINQPDNEMNELAEKIQAQAQEVISEYEKVIFELEKKLAIQQAVNGARVEEARIKAESQAEISEFKADVQSKLDILDTYLEIVKTQADNDGERAADQVAIREIINAVQTIQKEVQDQAKALEKVNKETMAQVEKRMTTTENDLKSLLEKANRPMDQKIAEIKAALGTKH